MYRYSAHPDRRAIAINLIAFYAGWFACVLGAAHDVVLPGLVLAGAVVGLHLALSADRPRSLRFILISIALGLLVDGGIGAAGLLTYAAADLPSPLPPTWILALWALLATTFDVSLRWLDGRPRLAGTLGFVAGPLSYLSGARLQALELTGSPLHLAMLGVVWAAVLVLLTHLSGRSHAATGRLGTGTPTAEAVTAANPSPDDRP